MVNETRKLYPALVDEIVPKTIGMQQLTEVLKRLLSEEASIRDLKTILQAIGEWYRIDGGNTLDLVEHIPWGDASSGFPLVLAAARRALLGLSTRPRHRRHAARFNPSRTSRTIPGP